MATGPTLRASRRSIGNLDGGSAGLGGLDSTRIQSGTGNFSTSSGGGGASYLPISFVNVGTGIRLSSQNVTGDIVSFLTIKAGEGIKIAETVDGVVVSTLNARTFTGLRDVPDSYEGQDGRVLVVDEANGRLVFSKASNVTVSDTPPNNASNGDGWWESTSGSLYIYYMENGQGQWVETGN